ncbi:MAG: type II secretion system F family protein [Planctomycetota bacterium]|nr:type II secretion system F family protein [Planctomycetota bacterium]
MARSPASQTLGVFYGQLAGLLKAGMPLPQALRTLATEAGSARFREAAERAATAIEQGAAPEAAFAAEEAQLGGLLGRVAGAAAASGRLPTLLAELSAWTLTQDRIHRRIADALMYPYTVLLFASLLCLVMMVVASHWGLRDIWVEFDNYSPRKLSSPSVSEVLAWCGIVGTCALTLSVPLTALLARLSPGVRRMRERFLVYMPVVGAVTRPLALSRLCGSAAVLLKADVPYHDAVVAGGELSGFAPYREAARKAAETLKAGGPQTEAWGDKRLFPASLRFILASAEKRGDVPAAFAELAELYRVEAEGRGRVVAVLAPPACLVGVGVVIALFINGMLEPLIRAIQVMSFLG